MPERDPDFEDDKVRLWRGEPPDLHPSDDPTVLRVDMASEEPYESRVYRVRHGVENLATLMAIMRRPGPERSALPLPVAALLAERFLREGLVKLLSKRQKVKGDISLLITANAFDRRFLLRPLRTYTPSGYLRKIDRFEREWVDEGLLVPGPVVTPQDWADYNSSTDSPPLK